MDIDGVIVFEITGNPRDLIINIVQTENHFFFSITRGKEENYKLLLTSETAFLSRKDVVESLVDTLIFIKTEREKRIAGGILLNSHIERVKDALSNGEDKVETCLLLK